MSAWTHPMCDDCWEAEHGERIPVRLREPDLERCALCGEPTQSGIYFRADPASVAYPRVEAPR